MEKTYDDFLGSITWSGDEFHLQDQKQVDKENFEKVQNYYKTCMDMSKLDALGPAPVYPLITKVFPKTLDAESITDSILAARGQSITSLLNSFIDADEKNPDVYAIKFSQPDLTLPKELYAKPETLQTFRSALIALFDAVLGDHASNTPASQAQKAQEAGLKLLSKDEIAATADRIVEFEKKLATLLVNE